VFDWSVNNMVLKVTKFDSSTKPLLDIRSKFTEDLKQLTFIPDRIYLAANSL